MNLRVILVASITILALGIVSSTSHNAIASSTDGSNVLKKDLKSIMNSYKLSIEKARESFVNSIKKANYDAKLSVKKGIPMDEINSMTKITISKAREDLKLGIQQAKLEAKSQLLQIKAALDEKSNS